MVTSSPRDLGDAWSVALWGGGLLLLLLIQSSAHPTVPPHSHQQMPPHFDTHTALSCFSQSRGSLALSCTDPATSMVRIERVGYHYAAEGSCLPSPFHCTYVAPELEVYPCVGRGSCAINTPTGGLGPELRACDGNRATYMTVRFQCIPVSENVDVCATPKLTSQWGFITSPRYPLNYLPSANCSLRLRAPHANQRLHVRLIDLRLENTHATCSDWLQLFDGHRSETYCNVRSDHQAMTTFSNWLQITFQTDANTTWKGFWLYYEAFPYIDTPHLVQALTSTTSHQPLRAHDAGPKTTTTHPLDFHAALDKPKPSNGTIGGKSPPTASKQHQHAARVSLTVGIIVGVVLGILLCITVVLAVVLVIRK